MSMIVLNGDRIVSNLRRAGVTPSGVRRRAADRIFMKPFDGIGVRVGQPFRVMEQRPPGAPCVTTQFHPLKAPVWSGRAIAGGGVFKISLGGMRLEMRLADQRRPVADFRRGDASHVVEGRRQENVKVGSFGQFTYQHD